VVVTDGRKTEKVPSLSPGRGTLTSKWASTKLFYTGRSFWF